MLMAQVTDTHIVAPGKLANGRVDTAAMLRACVDSVRALTVPPDLLVLTGDLVDAGAADEYAHLKSLLAPLSLPTLVIAGNHDSREGLRAAFPGLPSSGFVQYVHDAGPLRFVALDTLVGGRRALTCPSPAHQIPLDLRDEPFEGFDFEPPGFMLHRWTGDGLVTHQQPVGTFAGPFPF